MLPRFTVVGSGENERFVRKHMPFSRELIDIHGTVFETIYIETIRIMRH